MIMNKFINGVGTIDNIDDEKKNGVDTADDDDDKMELIHPEMHGDNVFYNNLNG